MIPVELVVPSVVRIFAVPAAGTVVAVHCTTVFIFDGTTEYVPSTAKVQALTAEYPVVVKIWNPLVVATAGTILIGTGNTMLHCATVVL